MKLSKYLAVLLIVVGVLGLIMNMNIIPYSRSLTRAVAIIIAVVAFYNLLRMVIQYSRTHTFDAAEAITYTAVLIVCLMLSDGKSFIVSSWKILWPIGIILFGIGIYFYFRNHPSLYDDWQVRIGDWEVKNPVAKTLISIAAVLFAIFIVAAVLFGVVTPVLAVVLIIVGGVLLIPIGVTLFSIIISIGAALLPLLIIGVILLAPIILVLWLFSLIF